MELILILLVFFVSYSPLVLILMFVFYLLVGVIILIYMLSSYLYSYLIFLLFISGLLVMLMYLCSVVLNEKLSMFNIKMMLISMSLFVLVSIFNFNVVNNFCNLVFFYEFNNLIKFFIYPYNLISLFFILYLLFCLMVVYELLKGGKSPLRSKS